MPSTHRASRRLELVCSRSQPANGNSCGSVASRQPHLSVRPAGRTRVRAAGPVPGSPAFGVDELPGAPRHGVRVDGADLGCEFTLMALVDEDGLGHGSVCGVHGEAPMLLILAHVHELRDVRQFAGPSPVARHSMARVSSIWREMRVRCDFWRS